MMTNILVPERLTNQTAAMGHRIKRMLPDYILFFY